MSLVANNPLDNKYTVWYTNIVDYARSQKRVKDGLSYFEEHHIVPRSLGGTDSDENLVLLTFKEHFVCHHLLTKMYVGRCKMKMCYAFFSMRRGNQNIKRKLTVGQIKYLKTAITEYKHRTINKGKITVKDSNGKVFHVDTNDSRFVSGELIHVSKGHKRNWSDEEKRKIYSTHKGRKYSTEELERRKPRQTPAWNKGKQTGQLSEETKDKMRKSASKEAKPVVQCPNCLKSGGLPAMKRYHFENCKRKI